MITPFPRFFSRSAQTTLDYMILTGVVLAVVVPLLYLSTERLGGVGISQVTEAIQALKSGILEIDNLGYGAGKRIVIQIPKGVETQLVSNGQFYYKINNQIVSATVPSDLAGTLPTTEGRHFVNLFNDGQKIYFYQCGNNELEIFEQCDGDKGDGDKGTCPSSLGCIDPSSPVAGCLCYCDPGDPNSCTTSASYGNCVTDPQTKISYCAPCTDNSQCTPGNICEFGNCVPDVCAQSSGGVRCGTFLNPVCCKQGELCVNNQCVIPCSQTTPCAGGQICVNGQCQASVCGDGRVDPPLEVCDPPNQQSTCNNGKVCGATCQSCVPSSPFCGNGFPLEIGEQCEYDPTLGVFTGCPLSTPFCDPSTCTCNFVQQIPCTNPKTLCTGNYVCDQTNTCSPCGSSNPCPNGYSCLADGTCQLPPGAGKCGNGQLEQPLGEECEYIIGDTGQLTMTSYCQSPTEPSCNTQDCTCSPNPSLGFCGDASIQSSFGEECDEGTNGGSSTTCQTLGLGPTCGIDCQCERSPSFCGDGILDPTAGEKCEIPGSFGPNNGCPQGSMCGTDCSCSAPQCGNGRVEPGEQCDTLAYPGCLIGNSLTPFISYCSSSCTCMYIDPPPSPQPSGGSPPTGGNGAGGPVTPRGPHGPGYPGPSSGGYLTCQEDDPNNPGKKKPTCASANDCGDPKKYFCRYNCCFPIGGASGTCAIPGVQSCTLPDDCGDPTAYNCLNNCCQPLTGGQSPLE